MSVGKSVVFLLFMLVLLIIYTVNSFDYNKLLAKDITKDEPSSNSINLDSIMSKVTEIKDEILLSLDATKKEVQTQESLIQEESAEEVEVKEEISTIEAPKTDVKLKKEEKILLNPESSKTITEPNIIETKVIEEKTITLEKVKEEPKVEVKKEEKVPSDSKIVQKEINDILAKNKIIFERRSTTVTKKSNLVLKQIVKILKREKNVKVEVAGHTDSRGKASLNKKLSQQRANSVRKALIYYGVEKERLTAVGYGEEQPIAKDDKNGLSIVNRRVEFNIVGE